jgi:heme exporter protein C
MRIAFLIITSLLMLVNMYLIFMWVPTEQNLGISQRIFYVHVPVAWVGMVAIFVVAIGSVLHLITRNDRWDAIAYSAAEIGLIFGTLMLVTGALWAKPAWGVWWQWDPKLTTALILWFIYVGYLMVRAYAPSGSQGRRYASVVALIGAIDAPIIYMASVWWRTAHPDLNIGPLAESSLDTNMLMVWLYSTVTFTVFYVYLLIERISMRKAEDDIDEVYQYANFSS